MLADIDPIIHSPKRLAAMAILANAAVVSFRFFKQELALSDSDLSKQMSALESAGYVTIAKSGHGKGGSTSYRLTKAGARAYERHSAAIRALLLQPADSSERQWH